VGLDVDGVLDLARTFGGFTLRPDKAPP
jgi:hypothetical protein